MMKFHRITVSPINPDHLMSGLNTRIEMDGQPLVGVTSLSFTIAKGSVATVRLEMMATVEVDGTVHVTTGTEPDGND